MKIKTKEYRQNYKSVIKAFTDSRLKLRFCAYYILLFTCASIAVNAEIPSEQLDPVDILLNCSDNPCKKPGTQSSQTEELSRPEPHLQQISNNLFLPIPANLINRIDEKLPQDGFTAIQKPRDFLNEYDLWQAQIGAPEEQKSNKNSRQLQKIIGQIRSIEFKPKKQAPKPEIVAEPETEPNEPPQDKTVSTEQTTESEKQQSKAVLLPYEPLTNQTLQRLETLLEHPDKAENVFELAEVLFLSGHLKEAAVFYMEALNADQAGSDHQRAWILFQRGNCLRNSDRQSAREMYRQLISEYPDSPWTELAKARDKLIDWYQKEQPRQLLSESEL